MSEAVAVVLFVGVSAYALFAGADFGAGFWDLVAGGARRGERPRAVIDHSIGPVWEVNHVWLIFSLVVLWTAFPEAFGSIMLTLFVPFSLVALGIVLRGSSFAFRKEVFRTSSQRNFGAAFASSSVIVPFCLGAVAGAIASGRVPAGGEAGDPWDSWINPTAILGGVLAVTVCAFLAAVYLVWDARRLGEPTMAEYFRRRAVAASIVAGLVAIAGIFVLRDDARYLYDNLVGRALPLVIVSAICGVGALVLLLRANHRGARLLAAGAVATVIWGWGVAQWPYMLPETLKVSQAAAPDPTLATVLVVFAVAAVVILPSIAIVFVLDQRSQLEATQPASGVGPVFVAEGNEPDDRHRVVIVGGGFAGLSAAKAFKHSDIRVTLIDRAAHHLFQPMLYQCAAGGLSEGQIAPPLRAVLRRHENVECLLAEVVDVDLERRVVTAERPLGSLVEVPYDSLIVGAGVGQSYFGHDEFAQFAPGMKTIHDALKVRRRIFGAFEMAESATEESERDAWLSFALVGAGPTGVELAGQIREVADHSLRGEYRNIDPSTARVMLFDGGAEPLATFGEGLAARAARSLERVGVELHMHSIVTGIDSEGLDVKGPDGTMTRYTARTVLWTAGVAASPLAGRLATAAGGQVDRSGRIMVEPDCTVPGHPEVFAVGDMMHLDDLPGLAEVAMQSGRYAARTIRHRVEDRAPLKPFRYKDLGSMAYISRRSAVVNLRGIKLSGRLAWWTWLAVHIATLTTWRNRISALGSWIAAFARRRRNQRTMMAGDLYPPPADPSSDDSRS